MIKSSEEMKNESKSYIEEYKKAYYTFKGFSLFLIISCITIPLLIDWILWYFDASYANRYIHFTIASFIVAMVSFGMILKDAKALIWPKQVFLKWPKELKTIYLYSLGVWMLSFIWLILFLNYHLFPRTLLYAWLEKACWYTKEQTHALVLKALSSNNDKEKIELGEKIKKCYMKQSEKEQKNK